MLPAAKQIFLTECCFRRWLTRIAQAAKKRQRKQKRSHKNVALKGTAAALFIITNTSQLNNGIIGIGINNCNIIQKENNLRLLTRSQHVIFKNAGITAVILQSGQHRFYF